MEKIFNQKNFNNFIWSPLGSRGNIYINFCLQVHFQVSSAWFCSNYLQICRRCRWYRWQFATGVVDTGGKFAAGIFGTGGKFATGVNNTRGIGGKICRRCRWYRWQICHRCRWHRWCTLTCEYLHEFSKKFEMILMLLSGAWGKVIHEKTWSKKSRDTIPLSREVDVCYIWSLHVWSYDLLFSPLFVYFLNHCFEPEFIWVIWTKTYYQNLES